MLHTLLDMGHDFQMYFNVFISLRNSESVLLLNSVFAEMVIPQKIMEFVKGTTKYSNHKFLFSFQEKANKQHIRTYER